MRTLAFAAVCAILTQQCHSRESSLSRPKRTLRMLESLFGSMRDTFSPLTAAAALPPAQAPSEVIVATKYPVGVKYALYPTLRMHIRPIQQHVIYMQSIPSMPSIASMPAIPAMRAPMLHPVRPPNGGGVEMLRPMPPPPLPPPPIVRMPKTKTTTTIHYEIIPFPVPVQSEPHAFPAPSPPPPPPPPPSLSQSQSQSQSPPPYDEQNDEDSVPWSLDELPPPVPTSAPLNPADEPNVPWNLHALPPPVATKQPRENDGFGWPIGSSHQNSADDYMLPFFDKKFTLPGQGVGSLRGRHRGIFRPSPLQSEITVQPSVEVAAYSEIQTLARQPDEYVNRLRNLNSPKPQLFPNHNHRLRREAPSAYFIDTDHRLVHMSPNQRPAEARILSTVLTPYNSETKTDYEKWPDLTIRPHSQPIRRPAGVDAYLYPNPSNPSNPSNRKPFLANYDSVGSEKADSLPEHSSPLQLLRNTTRDIRLSALLSETAPEGYVLITPRPANYTRRLNADPVRTETQRVEGSSRMSHPEPQSSNLFRSAPREDKRWPREPEVADYLGGSRGHSRFPPTGLLSKLPRRRENRRPSLFSNKKSPLSVDSFFDGGQTESRSAAKSHLDDFLRSDYDNVEYFEPIIIDVDEQDQKSDFGPKVKFKFKNFELKKSTREPLRLPGRLHETIDHLSEALMHPPIFDMESEANEPEAVIVVIGNEIT